MTDIRALTIRQPWAWAICSDRKKVENRTRATHYRGPLLIHAGQRIDYDAQMPGGLAMPPMGMVLGAVIAIAELTDCHFESRSWRYGGSDACCGAWSELDAWHWTLANVRKLAEPIPCRGQQGLWRPPADVLELLDGVL